MRVRAGFQRELRSVSVEGPFRAISSKPVGRVYHCGMTSHLRAITVRHYRCFADSFPLELRPLTFLYGWNGAGKSALVSLFRGIAAAVREDADAPLGDVGRFSELVWKGKSTTEDTGFWLTLEWNEASLCRATWHLDSNRHGRATISSLKIESQDGRPTLTLVGSARAGPVGLSPVEQATFVGLVPVSDRGPAEELARRLRAFRDRIEWLGTTRARVPRTIDPALPPPRRPTGDGAGALERLLADRETRRLVAAWYEGKPMGRVLKFGPEGRLQRPLLQPMGPSFDVDFADAGAGHTQVLPVLEAVARAELAARDGPAIVAMEEPESHLHPNGQRALAKWLCERIAGDQPPTLLVETHSPLFVAAVQLEIARRPDLRERVGAYWIEQSADGSSDGPLVTFDAKGRPQGAGWPRDAFADGREIARALVDLRLDTSEPRD